MIFFVAGIILLGSVLVLRVYLDAIEVEETFKKITPPPVPVGTIPKAGGYFTVKSKVQLAKLPLHSIIPESDFSTLAPDGTFIQLEYHEEASEGRAPYDVKPGVYTIFKTMAGFCLEKTAFVNDAILDEFADTQEVESRIDCFFNNLEVYKKMGFEVAKRGMLLYGPAGCHAKGTKILMFDGSTQNVEDIKVGEFLMGPDSNPREVLQLARNSQEMVKITPNKGEEFIVNLDHILHLSPSGEMHTRSNLNMSVRDYLKQTECFREGYKLTRSSVDFPKKELPISPYILGLWLGDGTSANIGLTTADSVIKTEWLRFADEHNLDHKIYKQQTNSRCETISLSSFEKTVGKNTVLNTFKELELINNKHIPKMYLTSDRKDRLDLLAGLIDTDGTTGFSDLAISKGKFGTGYSYVSKLERLADNVVYLCRSLGFAAYKTKQHKKCYVGKKPVFEGEYFYVSISGDLEEVPVKLDRKKCKERVMNKDVLRTGFSVEMLPVDNYYGFSLDSDHLYLTADFTIHHNTGKTTNINKASRKYVNDGKTVVVVWPTDKYEAYEVKDFVKTFAYKGVDKMIFVLEDIGGVEMEGVRVKSDSSLLSLLDNQEKTFTIPVMIIATTNHPEMFLANLTNRPNRFDDKIRVGFPKPEARVGLLKFFAKDHITISDSVCTILASNKCTDFSPAHIREVVVRSMIFSKSPDEVINSMVQEIADYKKDFADKPQGGMGFGY